MNEELLRILTDFENKYPPVAEKRLDGAKDSVKKNGRRKAKGTNGAKKKSVDDNSELEKTTSEQLFNHLFGACNILRGPINQDEYKSYVTPILFFKRISDVFDEETAKALEESGGDLEYAELPEQHSFVIPEGCHWKDIRNATKDVGQAIVNAMSGVERANPDTLSGVFSSFDDAVWTDKTKLTDERLKDLIEHMSSLNVGNHAYASDVMGDAYEYLIKKFADIAKKNAGEFYTPRTIVKLMVMLLDPQPGDTVYDPACGTAGMLIEAIRHINNERMTYGKMYGQENNLSNAAIARMNLFLHGAKDFKIIKGDTLREPAFIENGTLKQFDHVLANPPFGYKNWGATAFESDKYGRNFWGSPTDSSADFAWLQHMIKSMNEKTGKCAVVMPQGALFHSGTEGTIRQKLVESDKLECVITLVGGVFFSTGVSACILLLNNHKPKEHKGKVCLIDASTIYTPYRAQKVMEEPDIQKVFDIYRQYEDIVELCKVATIKDIEANGYDLSVGRYIDQKPIEIKPYEQVKAEYFAALDAVKQNEARLKDLLASGGYIGE